jgi:addiction module HigA family antidote
MKKIPLAHPGKILRREFIEPNGLTVYGVARQCGLSQPTLQLIVSGRRSITAETALRLGLYFGIDAQFWLNLQTDYDLRIAKSRKLKRIAQQVRPLALEAA